MFNDLSLLLDKKLLLALDLFSLGCDLLALQLVRLQAATDRQQRDKTAATTDIRPPAFQLVQTTCRF